MTHNTYPQGPDKIYLENDEFVDCIAVLEGDKTETPTSTCVLISLELTLGDFAVFFEERLEFCFVGLGQTTYKYLVTSLLGLVFWNCSLHIDLEVGDVGDREFAAWDIFK